MGDSLNTGDVAAEHTPTREMDGDHFVSEPIPQAAAVLLSGSEAEQAAALTDMAHAATLPLEERVEAGLPHCQRCEVFPRPLDGPGVLHLNLPHTHTLGKVLGWLVRAGHPHTRRAGVVSVRVPAGPVAPLVAPLLDLLTLTERRDTRVVFQHADQMLQVVDYFAVEDLPTFAARAGSGWLLDLMRNDRLTPYFQPILAAGDGRTVLGYECLLRATVDGRLVPAGPMFDAARRADLLFQLDVAARRAALKGAARRGIRGKVFVNFTPNAVYDARTCLASTVRLADELGLDRGAVIFEVTETERLPDLGHLKEIVDYYREHGFGVALDDVGTGYSSLRVLLELRPDYVKLDMDLIRGVHADRGKAVLAGKLLEAARELGLRTVAEGVEVRDEWDWVRDHGADFVQGFLFARPAAEPAAPTAVPPRPALAGRALTGAAPPCQNHRQRGLDPPGRPVGDRGAVDPDHPRGPPPHGGHAEDPQRHLLPVTRAESRIGVGRKVAKTFPGWGRRSKFFDCRQREVVGDAGRRLAGPQDEGESARPGVAVDLDPVPRPVGRVAAEETGDLGRRPAEEHFHVRPAARAGDVNTSARPSPSRSAAATDTPPAKSGA